MKDQIGPIFSTGTGATARTNSILKPVASNGTQLAVYDGAVAPVAIRGPWDSAESVSLPNQSRKALQGLALDDAIRLVGDHAQLDQLVSSPVCQSLEGSTADTQGRTPGRCL